ncbi:fluoride efflux transporter CrcB [Stutzerimonas tarimensis]|uniref:Fluoride-specific ion channel FluC n=1 Tax=Stutzerimonas tarimensis TaxID=1507735 RepID=A0ABV7T177_9GAMM
MLRTLLAVALGGLVGTFLRFGLGLWVGAQWPRYAFVATLLVNLSGCLAIGYVHGYFLTRPELPAELRTGLVIGLLGALTTFSSFSLDSLRLLENGQIGTAAGYLGISLFGGLMATWFGLGLARM